MFSYEFEHFFMYPEAIFFFVVVNVFTINSLKFPVVPEEEQEVPSRNLLKRQALMIVDMKSRRKGYRAPKRK